MNLFDSNFYVLHQQCKYFSLVMVIVRKGHSKILEANTWAFFKLTFYKSCQSCSAIEMIQGLYSRYEFASVNYDSVAYGFFKEF